MDSSQTSDWTQLSSSLLKSEKHKCLKNLNKMTFSLGENSASSSFASQEKTFLENLPKDFFQTNENVLSASRNDEWEINKLNSSIEQASHLLKSIHRNASTTTEDNGMEDTSHTNVSLEHASAFSKFNRPVTNPCHSINSTDSSRSECCDTSNSTITNLVLPQNLNSTEHCPQPESIVPNHRHRRVWNLKQAKHLWENEELIIPERQSHSEPSSTRCSPLLTQSLSYSLNCLDEEPHSSGDSANHPNPVSLGSIPSTSTRDNLEKPVSCLERSIDTLETSAEEDFNLYTYYMNLYKDMSGFVSQQGELMSPRPEDSHTHEGESFGEFSRESTLKENIKESGKPAGETPFPCDEYRQRQNTNEESCEDKNSYSDHPEDSERNSNLFSSLGNSTTNTHWVPASSYPSDLMQFPNDEDFDLEIPDNLDDIEQFLRDLQRSQEVEMAHLLRKQQEEQAWLKQRQQRLKDSVLSVSSRSSSQQSSLNCSQLSMQDADVSSLNSVSADYERTKALGGPIETARTANIEGGNAGNDSNQNRKTVPVAQISIGNHVNSKEQTTLEDNFSQNKLELNNSKPSRTHGKPQTLPSETGGTASPSNKLLESNKSTPSQHYDSCEEWFTPEADKTSLSSQGRGKSVDKDGYADLLLSDEEGQQLYKSEEGDQITVSAPSSHSIQSQNSAHLTTRPSKPTPQSETLSHDLPVEEAMSNTPSSQHTTQWGNKRDLDIVLDEKSKASIQEYIRQWAELSSRTELDLSTTFMQEDAPNVFGVEEEHHTRPLHVTNKSVGVLRDIINTTHSLHKPLVGESEWKKLLSKEKNSENTLQNPQGVKEFEKDSNIDFVSTKHPKKETFQQSATVGPNELQKVNQQRTLVNTSDQVLVESQDGSYKRDEKPSYDVQTLNSKQLDDEEQAALLWQQWKEEIQASKMANHSNNQESPPVIPSFSEPSVNPTFRELFGSDESSNSSETSSIGNGTSGNIGNVEFSPETQAKLVGILGKEWPREIMSKHDIENCSQTDHLRPLPSSSISKSQLFDEFPKSSPPQLTTSSTAVHPTSTSHPSSIILPESIGHSEPSFKNTYSEEKNPSTVKRLHVVHSTQVEPYQEVMQPSLKWIQAPISTQDARPSPHTTSSKESTKDIPSSKELVLSTKDIDSSKELVLSSKDNTPTVLSNHSPNSSPEFSETSRRSSSENLSRQLSLDSVKQKYLLTPNVKRTPGLHEFETNVMSRLHREASNRPKTIIKAEYTEREKAAALTITAAARGFLVRRLWRTMRVRHIKDTIRDTLQCALALQSDPASPSPRDLELHTRLIQQLTAACYDLYDTFFSLSTGEKLHLIAQDRERLKSVKLATKRPSLPTVATLARMRRAATSMSEPKNVSNPGAVKVEKKTGVSRVRRSRSVSSQDAVSIKSSDSTASSVSGSLYRVSQSQSNTLNTKVPSIRRRLLLT